MRERSPGTPTEGIRPALVCCTGGEEGEILNPAADTPEVRADLGAVRMAELRASVDAIGYAELYLLGYRDSGMPGTEANARADNFANAPFDQAVGKLVAVIRREQPQVLVTYGDERAFYEHPDHIRVHEISVVAFDAAGDPDRYPDAGQPWQPAKLYYSGFSFRRIRALHDAYEQIGEESPYAERIAQMEERWGRAERADHAADHPRRRRRLPGGAAAGADRAPHADRSREPLDAGVRRPVARDVPVGGVRAGPFAGARISRCRAPTSPSTTSSPACAPRGGPDRREDRRYGVSDGVDEHWLDGWVGRGRAPGGSGAVQVVVTGLPDGDGRGRCRSTTAWWPRWRPARRPRRPLTLTMPAAVAGAVAGGELTASAAFMQGRMKTAGDLGLVLDVLAAVDSRV